MSKNKYPSIFSPQMATIVFIILQIFFGTRAVLEIGEYINNSRHLARKSSSETQGLLAGTMRYFRAKVYFKC